MYRTCILISFLLLSSSIVYNQTLERRINLGGITNLVNSNNQLLILTDNTGKSNLYNGQEVLDDLKLGTGKLIGQSNEQYYFQRSNEILLSDDLQNFIPILELEEGETCLQAIQDNTQHYISTNKALYLVDIMTLGKTKLFVNNLHTTENLACSNQECFVALNNMIIDLKEPDIVIGNLPEQITGLHFTENIGLLASSISNLWVFEGNIGKKVTPQLGVIPSNIESIDCHESTCYLIAENKLHLLDWNNSTVESIGEFSGSFTSSSIDSWDSYWLASNTGLWNYTQDTRKFKPPLLSITSIQDNNNQNYQNQDTIDHSIETVKVDIASLYLPNHTKMTTEWKAKNNWVEFQSSFTIPASQLKTGFNEIAIRGFTDNSVIAVPIKLNLYKSKKKSAAPLALIFGSVGLLLLSSIALISFLFNSRNKRAFQIEIDKLKAQNALYQSQQQIDQLKMNPHFIFNALASINGLLALNEVKKGRKAIKLFSNFLRKFLYQSQTTEITIENESELLDQYLQIEQICREGLFDFEITIEDESILDHKIPNMVLQPFVENSVVHAFSEKEEKGHIKIWIGKEGSYIKAIIDDNGKGMQGAKQVSKDHKSVAVDLVRKRLKLSDKSRRKEYVRYSDNNPGTRVEVYLSLSQ